MIMLMIKLMIARARATAVRVAIRVIRSSIGGDRSCIRCDRLVRKRVELQLHSWLRCGEYRREAAARQSSTSLYAKPS